MDEKYYQIDEVAKVTEMTKRTIRYYEDMELIKPLRTDANYRLYTEKDIENIREIRNLRDKLGMNLTQIQHFLGLRKSIKDILDGKVKDAEKISDAQTKLNELLLIVDEREQVLKRIKNNCNNYLSELSKAAKQ